ncbi:MAG TPA: FKBP-type peptidyl-prolyl cis-trans isomerase [Solirubrobacterales bacterium]|nr:FKBP-type peptidyl-prolyl cis-trans isomerase [Solirubrobacterales bacterium]
MKFFLLACALCLALAAGVSGCGGGDATSSETQESRAAATADDPASGTGDSGASTPDDEGNSGEDGSEGDAKPEDSTPEPASPNVAIGEYEGEGPFSAVSGQGGNKKPRFTPSDEPPPEKIVTRDLEVGSGPAAQAGDKASIYFAGAIYETGKVQLYGWPPSDPSVVELGAGLYGKSWEKAIEGMQVGGIRQVVLPSSLFAQGKPVDYVIVLTSLKPKSEA